MAPRAPKSKPKSKARAKPKTVSARPKAQSKSKAKPAAPARRSRLRLIVDLGLTLAVWGLVIGGAVVTYFAYGLPDVEQALGQTRRPSITLVAADGRPVASFGDVTAAPVTLAAMPAHLPQAVLATEDRRFYDHFGIDIFGLMRATVANIKAGGVVQGGSTITQQLAKNLFLSPARTFTRKFREVLMALWLERKFTKDQILTLYLNRVYLGAGTYGVGAAARRYFNRSVADLTMYQSAMIAGLLKAPSRYNPARDPERADRRTRQVLRNMVAAGFVSEADIKGVGPGRNMAKTAGGSGRGARYFADWVMTAVEADVGRVSGDVTVLTTLDADLQRVVEAQVRAMLDGPGAKARAGQATVVVMAPDGAVLAMIGGKDYGASQFNRATQARRQPGSAFKPFVYLAGLDAGLTPDAQVRDAPITIDGWSPANFSKRFEGEMTLRTAMARSVNTVAVRVAQQVGPAAVIDVALRLGITSPMSPKPALALGTDEVAPIELAAAYAAFASGGIGAWPYGVREVHDAAGRVLYARTGGGPGRVMPKAQAQAMNDMLNAVVRHGTGRKAALADRPAAGKTGTSQDFRDAWFVGYTADRVAVVWMGNDNAAPMARVTGSGLPARLWKSVMTEAHQGLPPRPLPGLAMPKSFGTKIKPQSKGKPVPAPKPASEPGFFDRLFKLFGDD